MRLLWVVSEKHQEDLHEPLIKICYFFKGSAHNFYGYVPITYMLDKINGSGRGNILDHVNGQVSFDVYRKQTNYSIL